MLGVGGWLIFDLRQRALTDHRQEMVRSVVMLADHADRALQAIELVQKAFLDDLRDAEVGDEAAFRQRVATQAFHGILRDRATALPQIDAMTVIGVSGDLLNFSRFWPVPAVNVADRDYFRALSSDPSLDRY